MADGLVALDLAAVPEVALVAAEGRLVAGHEHLVSRLLLAPRRSMSTIQLSRGCATSIPSGSVRYSHRSRDGRQTVLFDARRALCPGY